MNKFTAFFKRHRRGIITTTSFLAFDVVMLLVVHPLIANIEDFNTRFFIVVPLAFVIYPAIFLLQVLFCIISEFKFPSGWLIYIAVELLSLIITLIIMKRCKNKADKKENHNV